VLYARSQILKRSTVVQIVDTEREKKEQLTFAALNVYTPAHKKAVIGESKSICEQADRAHSQYRNRIP